MKKLFLKLKQVFNALKKYKKKIMLGLSVFLVIFISMFLYINLTNPTKINKYIAHIINKGAPANPAFDDENFYKCVIDNYNDENNKSISYNTNLTNSQLSSINGLWCSGKNISSVVGLNKLSSLTYLDLSWNPHLKKIDMSGLNKLNNFNINYNYLLTSTINKVDKKLYFPINQKYIINTNVILPTQFSISNITDSMNRIESEKINDNSFYVKLSTVYDNQIGIKYYNSISEKTSSFYEYVRGFSFEEYDNVILLNNDTYSIKPKLNPSDDNVLNSFFLQNNCNDDSLSVDGNTIKALKGKNCSVTIKNNSNLYNIDVPINIVEINSPVYDINYQDKYIYMGDHYLTEQLNENISVINGEITTDETKYVNLGHLYVNYNNETLRTFDLSYVKNIPYSKYNLLGDSKYIYTKLDTNEEISTKFKTMRKNNLSSEIDLNQNTLKLYKSNDSNSNFYNIDFVRILSDVYDLSKNYIYVGTGSVDLSNINITNGNLNINQNKVEIKYNDEILDSYNIAKISSNKYVINTERKYIYTKSDIDKNTILSNVTFDNINGKVENNKLIIYYEDDIVDEYDIVNISSSEYMIGGNYIYVNDDEFNIENITCNNCAIELYNNKVNIKDNDEILDTYNISSIKSDVYDLSKDYIYSINNSFDISKIEAINCDIKEEDNKLVVYNGEDVIKTYDIVNIDLNSSTYDLSKDYIYLGTKEFDSSKIQSSNITYEEKDNKLYLKYNDDIIKSYKLIKVSSEDYEVKDGFIYVFTNTFDKNKINVTNGEFTLANDVVTIKYEDDILDIIKIVGISSNTYDLTKDYIYVRTDKLDKTLINTANVTLEEENNKLKVLYEDEVIKEYDIISISSEDYDLSNEYFYNKDIDINKINVINGTLEEVSNAINIKYNNEIIDSIKLIRLTSEEYTIGDDYIFIGNNEFDNSKINVINGSFEVNNNTLNIKYNDQIIDTYKIVGYKSNTYDLSKEYIYTNSFNNTKINYINCTGNINNNILEIKYNNEVLDSKKIISISSEKYDLTKDYIYLGVNELDLSKITVTNANLETKDNNLNIKYNDEIVKNYKLIMISSNVYDLNKEYIYTKNNSFNSNSISIINGSISVSDNVLNIKYNDQVIDSRNIVSISSTKYDLSKEYIYVGINTFNKNNVVCIKCNLEIINNNLNIKYEDEIIDTYKIASISSDKYDLTKDKIKIKKDVFSIDDITSINCEKEYIGNKLYIKYNNEILKEYTLYTRITGDVTGDDKITLSDVSRLFKHVRGKQIITDEETLSACDVTGDGKITLSDVSKLFKYVRGKISEL